MPITHNIHFSIMPKWLSFPQLVVRKQNLCYGALGLEDNRPRRYLLPEAPWMSLLTLPG